MNTRDTRRRILVAAALALAAAGSAQAQDRPDRATTIASINQILAKAEGASLTAMSGYGDLTIASHELTYDPETKGYVVRLTETIQTRLDGRLVTARVLWRSGGLGFRRLAALEDAATTVAVGNTEFPNRQLRRVKLTLETSSLRWTQDLEVLQGARRLSEDRRESGFRDFVSFFYRSGDSDDSVALRNALLRLKEIDAEENDASRD